MNKQTNSPEANAVTTANTFETANSMVILRPKTTPVVALIYKGFEDLEKLIGFVGSKPVLNTDMSIQFKKTLVKPNSVIMRNSFGEVVKVMTLAEASEQYDIAASAVYNAPEHANKVQAKPIKERKPKS